MSLSISIGELWEDEKHEVTVVGRVGDAVPALSQSVVPEPAREGQHAFVVLQELSVIESIPIPVQTVPATSLQLEAVNDFVDRVATIEGVQCVITEEGRKPGEVHITTFGADSKDTRFAVYEIESAMHKKHDAVVLDFHYRRADEADNEIAGLRAQKYYFSLWGELSADG